MNAHVPAISSELARALTDRIKVAVEGTWLLIQEAYTSRAWASLGYGSWDDYCTREFGACRLRLPREERQEVVASLREIGMSVRAIAAATGHDKETVGNDLRHLRQASGNRTPVRALTPAPAVLENVTRLRGSEIDDEEDPVDSAQIADFGPVPPPPGPRPVTGTDGKTYPQPVRPKPAPRAALTPQFQTAAADLTRVIAKIERLQADDRYRANLASIGALCLPEVRRAADVLRGLLSDLGHDNGDPQ